MRLSSLKITNFRNLSSFSLEPTQGFNIIHGPNGSGKTSVLEAIYLLGMARSFRSHLLNRTIQYEAASFAVVGTILGLDENPIKVGVEKYKNTKITLKVANEDKPSALVLAKLLPLKLIHPDSYNLINAGPKYRRQFLDWGLFHVEQSFFNSWQRFQRILKQRNAALQQGASYDQVKAWDNEFVVNAHALAAFRKKYVQQLLEKTSDLMKKVFQISHFDFDYYPGWNVQEDLVNVLAASYSRDLAFGYTQYGPQRADLTLKVNTLPVQDQLSRGEQKVLVYLLQLAQGALFKEITGKTCVYLVDDLAAELDHNRRQRLLGLLREQEAQVFITATDIAQVDHLPRQDAVFPL